jgi:3-methyl-2-oxobutanoate hydroxymethyltransferase
MNMTKVTVPILKEMKTRKEKIVALTSYDYPTTQLLNEAGVDVVLIGDSLGMVKLGHSSTLPVTVEDMLYHTRLVARAGGRALVVTDMPYLSYQASSQDAIRHSGAMLKAGAQAVKIEGGEEMVPVIQALRRAKIPVMGHIGMMPQSVHLYGGYKVQGRGAKNWKRVLRDARAIEKAGVFAVVLECIPSTLAKQITRAIKIPTIGIGAGASCDGQILVADDLFGLTKSPLPRFVKAYADLRVQMLRAARAYAKDVRRGAFPSKAQEYS